MLWVVLNRMLKRTLSQDSNSKIEWDLEEMKKAILDSADDYDNLVGG